MKKTIRYIGTALSVALALTLLAACGEQSAQGGETEEFISETYDSDGFDSVAESGDENDNNESNDNSDGTESNESGTEEEDEDNNTGTGGSSGGTVDLPKLPI